MRSPLCHSYFCTWSIHLITECGSYHICIITSLLPQQTEQLIEHPWLIINLNFIPDIKYSKLLFNKAKTFFFITQLRIFTFIWNAPYIHLIEFRYLRIHDKNTNDQNLNITAIKICWPIRGLMVPLILFKNIPAGKGLLFVRAEIYLSHWKFFLKAVSIYYELWVTTENLCSK